jgi:hypothetical protein
MKRSAMMLASVVALAALASAADSAFAKSPANSATYKLDASDPNAAKACTDKGGVVTTDKLGAKVCTLPLAACTVSAGTSNPYTLDPSDPNAAKACADACGTVSTDASGQKICTTPGTIAPATAPTTTREPHN